MGFRDDLEAATKRAESFERDLATAKEELSRVSERLETQDREVDRLRGRLRAAGITDEAPPRSRRGTLDRSMGIAALVLGLADLGFLFHLTRDWTGYLAEDHAALTALGREAYVDLATYADVAEAWILAGMSLALCAIGVGILLGHRWAAVASLLWATLALAFNGFTALSIDAIHGTFTEDAITGGVIMTIFPVVFFVYGLIAVRRLTRLYAAPQRRPEEDRSPG